MRRRKVKVLIDVESDDEDDQGKGSLVKGKKKKKSLPYFDALGIYPSTRPDEQEEEAWFLKLWDQC